jgi:hypothetical protein
MKQVAELKACVMQQRRTMRELRHDVRAMRLYGSDDTKSSIPRRTSRALLMNR